MDKEEEDNVEAVVVDTVETVGEEGDFSKLEKELKKVQERNTIVERKYLLCEKELRKKTEEAAKLKSEVKDSKQMLDLERQVKENNIFVGKDEDGEKNDSFTEENKLHQMKNSGYKRKNPQAQSSPVKPNVSNKENHSKYYKENIREKQ